MAKIKTITAPTFSIEVSLDELFAIEEITGNMTKDWLVDNLGEGPYSDRIWTATDALFDALHDTAEAYR